jgi:hypothetical protein
LFPFLAFISEILPIIFYLSFIKRNRGEGLRVIFLYCCISWLTEPFFVDRLFHLLNLNIPRYIVYASFTILEFTLFSFFFYTSLQGKRLKYIPIFGALIFYIVAIVNFIKGTADSFDSLPASLEAIMVISYCILLLYEQVNDPHVIFVYNTKKFWIIIAFFLYFSSSLFLFLYAKTFTQTDFDQYWSINNFFEILKNILFSIAFIMKKSENQPYPIENPDPDI